MSNCETFDWIELINSSLISDPDVRNNLIDFARSTQGMSIRPEEIKGDILVAGHGYEIPERIFFGSPQSGFRALRAEISSLTLCDDHVWKRPGEHLDLPVTYAYPERREDYLHDAGEVPFFHYPLQVVLPSVPPDQRYDAVLFFPCG